MRETWYVLEDGSVANPAECACDDSGVLRSKSGVAVAMRGDAYSSRGVDVDDTVQPAGKAIEADKPKGGYKTRESKAR